MDSKYGRIFTESDVKEIVQTAMENDFESEQDLVDFLETGFVGTFPSDEPVFVIRAKDNFAAPAVGDYLKRCIDGEVPAGGLHTASVQKAIDDIMGWQEANPELVKIPD